MPPRVPSITPRFSRVAAILLAIVGIQAWLLLGNADYGHRHELRWMLAAIILGSIPPMRRGLDRLWESFNRLSFRHRPAVALAISLISVPLILWTEHFQHINIRLYFHDEFSYLLQMHMLAHGRLWMPALPLPEFFDSFYIFVRPFYCSMYFPGTALVYLPEIFLHLPYYVAPLITCGISVGLVYWIMCEILDGACAALGVIVLQSISMFRLMSIMLLSEAPMLLMGLLMTFAYLRWQKNKSPRWALALGIAAGWAAITRPADAFCFALILSIAIVIDLWKMPRKIQVQTAALLLLGAIPFLSLQLIFNHAVTGKWLYTPFSLYTDQNYPGGNFGFHPLPPDDLQVSDLPQKQIFFQSTVLAKLRAHQLHNIGSIALSRFSQFANLAMPDPFFWLLLPMSLLAIWDRRRWAVWGPLILFVVIYTFYPWWIPGYAMPFFPAMLLLILSPIQWLSDNFPDQRAGIRTTLGISIAALAIASFPQFDRLISDQFFHMTELSQIDSDLSAHVSAPAIVLFHFTPGLDNPEEEPVFNSEVAWPDDAPIIRAHDRNIDDSALGTPGDLNRPLYEYYQKIAPERVIYIYDRHGRHPILQGLGTPNALLGPARPTFMTIK